MLYIWTYPAAGLPRDIYPCLTGQISEDYLEHEGVVNSRLHACKQVPGQWLVLVEYKASDFQKYVLLRQYQFQYTLQDESCTAVHDLDGAMSWARFCPKAQKRKRKKRSEIEVVPKCLISNFQQAWHFKVVCTRPSGLSLTSQIYFCLHLELI